MITERWCDILGESLHGFFLKKEEMTERRLRKHQIKEEIKWKPE
jgi:hypothetical protein